MRKLLTLMALVLVLTLALVSCGNKKPNDEITDENSGITDGGNTDDGGKTEGSVDGFAYSQGLEFTSDGRGTCYVSGIGSCTDTNIVIPPTSHNGDSVTGIGDRAFADCDSLISVVIPDSVISIGWYSFAHCDNLNSVVISDSVNSIGGMAFYSCDFLTSVAIPSSVTNIGEDAFAWCASLTSVVIPKSVTSIGNYAFRYCYSLYKIANESNLSFEFGSSDYGEIAKYAKVMINKDGNKIYNNTDTVEYIETEDNFLFEIENSTYTLIAYVGNNDTVTLPTDIYGNEYEIYRMCGIINVIIPKNVAGIDDWAFSDCYSLSSAIIENGVTSIGESAFFDCDSLSYVEIPDSVTSVGENAFSYCAKLNSVIIGESVTSIGKDAFGVCHSLTCITVDSDNEYYKSVDGNLYTKNGKTLIRYAIGKTDTEFTIPDSVISIDGDAFQDCYNISSVKIPDSVTSIGESAFLNCSNLKSMTVDSENEYYRSIDGNLYTKDGKTLVQYTVGKTDSLFVILDSVTNIGDSAFWGCTNLDSVTIGDDVTSIGSHAFWGCENLTEVYYTGSEEDWAKIEIYYGNSSLADATIHYNYEK